MRIILSLATLILASPVRADDPIRFRDVTQKSGILDPVNGIMGHGGAWGDFDGDGRPDLFVGGFCDRPNKEYLPATGPVTPRLFRNLGDGKFEWVRDAKIETPGRTSGAVFADLDNDGKPELYVANNAKNTPKTKVFPAAITQRSLLFRNTGGKLIDISADSSACPESMRTARNIGVLDYDNDGLLDLFIVEDKFINKPRSMLLRNLGKLQFEDVTKEAGLPEDIFGLGLAIADVNDDGRPDIFVGHSNRLFLSSDKGKYREVAELNAVFAWKPLDGEDWPCGAHFADLNRDGRLDLVVAIHSVKARNRVYLNQGMKDGVPQFRDVTEQTGLDAIVPVRCPHVEVQDFDNDGWPDIYLSAGWKDDTGNITPLIYRHLGLRDGVPHFAAPRKVELPMVYYPAGPSADFDGDGRLDLFLINWFTGDHCHLLQNESPKKNWLQVRVVGKKMNRDGIGSVIDVSHDGKLISHQEISIGYGYASGQMPIAHIGLGDISTVRVTVKLPNGALIVDKAVKANQRLTIEE